MPDDSSIILPGKPTPAKDVGGWLLFFCILLIVVIPIAVLIRAWTGGFELDGLIDIAWAGFGIFVGMLLWNVHRRAFLLLWIYFGVTTLMWILQIVSLVSAEDGPNIHELILTWRGVIYTVAWFIYFKKAERVQATFGRNL